ncbi:MAG: hypothetical protein MUE72_02085, partial [Chitinophagaceae bacterium]|nr:hypothetical protein [Chitinophagaceae bacterium]
MQTNWHNKIISSKIQSLTEITNEDQIDFGATWQKLEHTLHKKPRKIIPVYHWAAASAIVLFCSMFFLTHQSKNTKQNNGIVQLTPTVKSIKNADTVIITSNNLPLTRNKQKLALVKEKMAAERIVTVDTDTKNKIESAFTHPIITTSAQNNSNNNVIATVGKTEQPIIQTSLPPTKASVKSKRKVYHISELGQVLEDQNFADNKKSIKKQILEEED